MFSTIAEFDIIDFNTSSGCRSQNNCWLSAPIKWFQFQPKVVECINMRHTTENVGSNTIWFWIETYWILSQSHLRREFQQPHLWREGGEIRFEYCQTGAARRGAFSLQRAFNLWRIRVVKWFNISWQVLQRHCHHWKYWSKTDYSESTQKYLQISTFLKESKKYGRRYIWVVSLVDMLISSTPSPPWPLQANWHISQTQGKPKSFAQLLHQP